MKKFGNPLYNILEIYFTISWEINSTSNVEINFTSNLEINFISNFKINFTRIWKSTSQVICKQFHKKLEINSIINWEINFTSNIKINSTSTLEINYSTQDIWKLQLFLEKYLMCVLNKSISNSISTCAGHQQKILEMNCSAFQQLYLKLTESLSK